MIGSNGDAHSNPEADSENFLPIIKEYESVIETLTSQVEFYAKEQENLRKEITSLVNENKLLSQTVNELLDSQSIICRKVEQNRTDNELTENLKTQLNLTLKEKDTVVQLWQNALKNIDHLEEELKLFEGRTHGYFSKAEVSKIKQKYENQINELEDYLVKCRSKLDSVLKESAKNLENKNFDLKRALESQEATATTVKRLEDEVKRLQSKLDEIARMRDELQANLDGKIGIIEELKTKHIEAKAKVTEAIQIVEAAFYEKDAALLRENEAKEEVIKISKTLTEVVDEAAERIKTETENIKQEHELKVEMINQNMQSLKEELNAKNIQLEKYVRECKLLEEELERVKKGNICIDDSNTSKLLILEKNLESTFQKLLLSERKNLQLTSEKEYIKSDLEQMADCYKNDIKTREVEKQVLKHEVQTLRKQLKIRNRYLIQVKGEIRKMNGKIKLIDEIRDKVQTKELIHEQTIAKAVEEVQNKTVNVHNELHAYLKLQVVLNNKLRKEMYDIMGKLENRIKELKETNKCLRQKLKQAITDSLHYRKHLVDICNDVSNVMTVNKDSKSSQ